MIDIKNLVYQYESNSKYPVLNSINLQVKKGEFVSIVGENGCGKSTLVQHLNAILIPSKGTVQIEGLDTKKQSNIWSIRQKVGMVFQNPQSQFIGTTVQEDVAFGPENLALSNHEIRTRLDDALEQVGMLDFKEYNPMSLSGGQKQCVAIAGVLAMKPEYIVLDEITSMLDDKSQKTIFDIMKYLQKNGITIIYVTHRIKDVVNSDRIIVLSKGSILYNDKPQTVLKEPSLPESGIEIPPIVELANKLEKDGIIDTYNNKYLPFSNKELLEDLCQSI
ncbi:ABC transporter related protein [Methanohalobium evestigatum Z-7303]|uniref:ABC transporter related protein n=1 Tax=Methanohalobium evestigatum (strain ATCC BAA-1072 / DSM 3721 / NBRC 107634 / OCM 161 / Z-7303) TaxID=644295 RepID=D7EA20_METEZ|nr:energy-coupling factor transporter ATPase [Methanohalobium evestigatum]ADI74691.1 ABC transporter related protein [Methanohalobium evestigatum Z-7303]